MPTFEDKFEVFYNRCPILIQILSISGRTVYRVNLPGSPPIMITRAKNADKVFFWTSVPEGKQKQAEEIGKLIQEQITSQQ